MAFDGLFVAALVGVAVHAVFNDSDAGAAEAARRALGALPATPIAELRAGATARIVGRLTYAGAPLTAPLSGRPCAAYVASVVIPGGGAGGRVYVYEQRSTDFVLSDATGVAEVGAGSATLASPPAVLGSFRAGTFRKQAPSAYREFLARHGKSDRLLWFARRHLEFREAIVAPGMRVEVLARCRGHQPFVDGGDPYRERPSARALVDAPDGERVLIRSADLE